MSTTPRFKKRKTKSLSIDHEEEAGVVELRTQPDTVKEVKAKQARKIVVSRSFRSAKGFLSKAHSSHDTTHETNGKRLSTSASEDTLAETLSLQPRRKRPRTRTLTASHYDKAELPHDFYLKLSIELFTAMGLEEDVQYNMVHQIKKSASMKKNRNTVVCSAFADSMLTQMEKDIRTFQKRQKKHRAAVLIQSKFRSVRAQRIYNQQKRQYSEKKVAAYLELCNKEKHFVMNLATLVSQFIVPLRVSPDKQLQNISADLTTIFSEIEGILEVHQQLLKLIYEVPRNSWPRLHGVAESIISVAPNWKVYGKYVHNIKFAMEVLEECMMSCDHFNAFLERKARRTSMNLEMYLSLPLNHIAGYSLILKKILEQTPDDEENGAEHAALEQAITLSSETASYIANALGEAENIACIKRIRRTITPSPSTDSLFSSLIENNRSFVQEVNVEYTVSGMKKTQSGVLFLFESVCFLSVAVHKELCIKQTFDLSSVKVMSTPTDPISFSLFDIDEERPAYNQVIEESKYTFYCDCTETREKIVQNIQTYIARNQTNKTFGTSIETLVARDKPADNVPVVIKDLITFLEKHGMDTTGLFRIPGTVTIIKKVKQLYNQFQVTGKYPVLEEIEGFKANDAAGVLKMFFHDLPEPLIPPHMYEKFLAAHSNYKTNNNLIRYLQELKQLVDAIPEPNKSILQYMLKFLIKVKDREEIKMSASNLSTCFGPNILRPAKATIDSTLALPVTNKCFESLILHYDILFDTVVVALRRK